jgi:hypothetical protein
MAVHPTTRFTSDFANEQIITNIRRLIMMSFITLPTSYDHCKCHFQRRVIQRRGGGAERGARGMSDVTVSITVLRMQSNPNTDEKMAGNICLLPVYDTIREFLYCTKFLISSESTRNSS